MKTLCLTTTLETSRALLRLCPFPPPGALSFTLGRFTLSRDLGVRVDRKCSREQLRIEVSAQRGECRVERLGLNASFLINNRTQTSSMLEQRVARTIALDDEFTLTGDQWRFRLQLVDDGQDTDAFGLVRDLSPDGAPGPAAAPAAAPARAHAPAPAAASAPTPSKRAASPAQSPALFDVNVDVSERRSKVRRGEMSAEDLFVRTESKRKLDEATQVCAMGALCQNRSAAHLAKFSHGGRRITARGPWTVVDGTLHMRLTGDAANDASDEQRTRVAMFDLDSTLVEPKSGAKFAKSADDWRMWADQVAPKLRELYKDGFRLAIVSNQKGISTKKQSAASVEGRIDNVIAHIGVPMSAFAAAANDEWRKPLPTVFTRYLAGSHVRVSESLFVGDAAGRAGDFSCSDRAFAHNCGVQFFTPEEFFLGQPVDSVPFKWDSVDPSEIIAEHSGKSVFEPDHPPIVRSKQELVVFVGPPASGKSTFFKRHMADHGYVHVNQDTLKTRPACIKAARRALQEGHSVVVDNTNPAANVRQEYLAVANEQGVAARCFFFATPPEVAAHLNLVRLQTSDRERVPTVAFRSFKSRLAPPTTREGFEHVHTVQFVPDFDGLPGVKDAFFQRLGGK